MDYIRALDGIRGYAVLFVLLAHFPAISEVPMTATVIELCRAVGIGYFGVDLFFVLSGFLITSILLRQKKAGRLSFSGFYVKRLLRIFPIFYLSVIFCYLIGWIGTGEFLANALYVSNYFYSFESHPSPLRHTWSLSVEEQFYIIWPMIVLVLSFRNLKRAILFGLPILLLILLAMAFWIYGQHIFNTILYRATPFRMLSLCSGALLAILRYQGVRVPSLACVATIAVAASLLWLSVDMRNEGLLPDKWLSIAKLFAFSTICFSAIALVLNGADQRSAIIKFACENEAMRALGKISYGVYLYHFIVLYGLDMLATSYVMEVTWTRFVHAVLWTFFLALSSYLLVERPLLQLKDRLYNAKEKPE